MKKNFLLICIVLLIAFIGIFSVIKIGRPVIMKQLLSEEYCEYNGRHPEDIGLTVVTYGFCKVCGEKMQFSTHIKDSLCKFCATELNRCKRCSLLLD